MKNRDFCGIKVESPFFLAPMAGITALPFRLMCKRLGAGIVITEQVNATQIARNPDPFTNNEFFNIRTIDEEKPVGAQLFGTEENDFAEAVGIIEKNFEFLNINCGCPSHKEMSIGAGAALLKKPEKIASIVKAMKGATKKPVTAKIRIVSNVGKTLKIIEQIEKAEADAIMVHGRTAEQGYSGKSDWEVIRAIAKKSSIPVVSNGDANSGRKAWEMLKETGTEFGMIGRQAMVNPFVFKEAKEWEKQIKMQKKQANSAEREREEWKPSDEERIEAFFEYHKICQNLDMVKVRDLKLKATLFTKGVQFTKKVREKLNKTKNAEQIVEILEEFKEKIEKNENYPLIL